MSHSIRRLLFGLILVAALGILFASCEEDKKEPAGGETPPDGAGQPAPPEDQHVVMHSTEPEFFDPHRSNFEQDIAIERMLFRGLYQLQATADGGAEAVPAMAAGDPVVSDDGLTYTVTLTDGLLWSDDAPLTAQHFVDGILRGCDPTVASPYSYLLQSPDVGGIIGVAGCDEFAAASDASAEEQEALRADVGATAVDDTTLEITLLAPKPLATFKAIFSLWVTFPARLDVIEQYGEQWTDPANIVVNGPFTLTEFVAQDHVILEPNPNWALEPTPLLQELTIRFIDDFEAAFRSFQTGELDQARIPEAEVPTAQGDAALNDQLLIVGAGRMTSVEVQLDNEALSDFNVRLALSKAIDRDTLIEVANSGVGVPAEYWVVSGVTGYQGREPFQDLIGYDAEGAAAALEEAGYPGGEGFPTLTITILDTPARVAQAEFLQQAWSETLGITVEIRQVDARTRSTIFNEETFELFIGGWQLDYPDIENPIVGLFNTDGGNNKYNCSMPEIDAKIAEASSATDPAEHVTLFQEAETLIVSNLCGVIPYLQEALPYLISPKLGGVNESPTLDAGQPGNWCAECWFVQEQ